MKKESSITYKACAFARLMLRRLERLVRLSHVGELELDRQRRRHCLEILNHLLVIASLDSTGLQLDEPWNCLLKQLQALGAKFNRHRSESGDIAARMREARNQPGSDRISHSSHDDGNSGGGALKRLGCNGIPNDDYVDFAINQVCSQLRYATVVAICRSPLNQHVATLRVSRVY